MSLCTAVPTAPSFFRLINHDSAGPSQPTQTNALINGRTEHLNHTPEKHAQNIARKAANKNEAGGIQSYQGVGDNIKAWTTYRTNNTGLHGNKNCRVSPVIIKGDATDNIGVTLVNEGGDKKSNCITQKSNSYENVNIYGKVIEDKEGSGAHADEDGTYGSPKGVEEDKASNDRDSGHFSDYVENCETKSSLNFPDLLNCADEDVGAADCVAESPKEKKKQGKRVFYMWGNHKLVKPIKDIPKRFQVLLAESSAERLRCEGQPIYMQNTSGPNDHWNNAVVYSQSENTNLVNTDSSNVSHDGLEIQETVNPEVVFYQDPCYTNEVQYNGEASSCNSSIIQQNSTPVYGMPECATIQDNSNNVFVVFVPQSVSSHIIPSPPVGCAVHVVTAPSMCQSPKILQPHDVNNVPTAPYIIPTTTQVQHSAPRSTISTTSVDQTIGQNYHTIATDQAPPPTTTTFNYNISHNHQNTTINHQTPFSVIPPTFSKFTNPACATFPHLSTPPPNFPTSHMIGPFSQAPPTTLPPNYSPILISAPYSGWIMHSAPTLTEASPLWQ